MKDKATSRLNILILMAISFVVLFLSVKDNFDGIVNELLSVDWRFFIFSIFLMFGYWFFRTIAYHKIITKFDKNYSFKRTYGLMMLTQFFNGVTPFASGGQPFVVYNLKKDGIKLSDSTNIVVQDFITYQIALISLGSLAIMYNYFFDIFAKSALLREIVLVGYIINMVVLAALFILSFGRKMNKGVVHFIRRQIIKLKFIKKKDNAEEWEERINNFHDSAIVLFKDKKYFMSMIGLNLLALLSLYLIPVVLLYSLGDFNSFDGITAVVTSAYIMLVGSFVPIPGGTGGLEFAFLAFFANFTKGGILNAMMLLWRFITYYLGVAIGAVVFNIWKRRD